MLKLILVGALSKDATANQVGGQTAINFSIPHSEKYKKEGEKKEKTTWVECVIWTKEDKLSKYLKKGTQLSIVGTPEVNVYKTNDGSAKGTLQCRVLEFEFVPGGGKGDSSSSSTSSSPSNTGSSRKQATASSAQQEEQPDDLPF